MASSSAPLYVANGCLAAVAVRAILEQPESRLRFAAAASLRNLLGLYCFRRRCCAALAGGSAAACVCSRGPQASTRTGVAARAPSARAGRRWRPQAAAAGRRAAGARPARRGPALLFCWDAARNPYGSRAERSLDERLGPAPTGAGAGGRRGSWPLRAAVDGEGADGAGRARGARRWTRHAESETPPGQSRRPPSNRRRALLHRATGTRLRPRRMEVSASSGTL